MCELNQSWTRKEDQSSRELKEQTSEEKVKQKQLCELFAVTRSKVAETACLSRYRVKSDT